MTYKNILSSSHRCKLYLSTLFLGMGLSVATAQTTTDTIPKADQANISKYFDQYLKMGKGDFEERTPLDLSEVSETQAKVWDLWVKANNAYNEPKLIALGDLKPQSKGKWVLPSRLEANATMNYYYGCKNSIKPEAGYPLFLYLHGSGDRNYEWQTGLDICRGFQDSPSIYFIPQIPNTGEYYRWWQKAKQFAWEKLLRLSFVQGNVNPNRVYFFGISEGGYGSQRLASFYADYLAGAGPMAGGEPLINAPVENCANLAYSMITGANDDGFFRNKLTQYTQEAFDQLEKEHPGHFVHRILLLPNTGHSFDYRPTTPWLAKHERNPHPKKVMWENYFMDGQKRKGFYNLYLEKDPAGRLNWTIYYDMNIDDNVIKLDVSKVNYKNVESQQGIGLRYERTYQRINRGTIRIYLNDKLVDMSRPVKVIANDKVLFEGMVTPDLNDMVSSCATFYDPERVFPASILIDLSQQGTGIEEVGAENMAEKGYYDLSGRKVSHPQQGVYINEKGQKVFMK